MADQKISELTALATLEANDLFAVVDDSATQTKKITWANIVAGLASWTMTFTNKRFTKRVVTVSDATSITPNADTSDVVYQLNTQSAGTLTVNAPSGTPTDGQPLLLKIKCTNAQTFSWDPEYAAGASGSLPPNHPGGGKIVYYPLIRDAVNSKWHYTLSMSGGF